MKKIHLTLHVFPREIDDYEFTINQLKTASKFISNLQIDANVILNLNDKIIDWDNALLSKEYFIDRFKHANTKLDWINNLEEEIVYGQEYHGKLEKVLSNLNLEGYDAFWWQDVDLILDDLILYGIENTLKLIEEPDFIISPQTYKWWDNSWDVISNNPNIDIDVNEFDAFNIKPAQYDRELSLIPNKDVKFAGGWCTIVSNSFIKKIKFPKEIKGYGREDTLAMEIAKYLGVTQYIMKDIIVQENRKYLNNNLYIKYVPYNLEYLKSINALTAEIFIKLFQDLKLVLH
jgi:hypothetical protein